VPEPAKISHIYDGKIKVTFSPGRHTYMVDVPGLLKKAWFPSVTGILGVKAKPQLIKWASQKTVQYLEKRLGQRESQLGNPPFMLDTAEFHSMLADVEEGWNDDEATSIGSLAHRFLEAELKYRTEQAPKPERPRMDPVSLPGFTSTMVDMANSSISAGLQFLDEHEVRPIMLERVLFSPTEAFIGTVDFIGYVDDELVVGDWKTSKRLYVENWLQEAAYVHAYQEEFGKLIHTRYLWNIKKSGEGIEVEKRGIDFYQADWDCFSAAKTIYCWNREHDPWLKGVLPQPLSADWKTSV
jgi:PD-(D/E)XK nuclease superfamily protein